MIISDGIKFRWFDQEVRRKAEPLLNERMRQAAEVLAAGIRANIDAPAPPHSAPGDFPHKLSGELQGSITVRPLGKDWMVIATAAHAPFVERSRPFMVRTFNQYRSRIKRMIGRG